MGWGGGSDSLSLYEDTRAERAGVMRREGGGKKALLSRLNPPKRKKIWLFYETTTGKSIHGR